MPPKKDTNGSESTKLLKGFEDKETKLLAAAFVSCIGPDKVSAHLHRMTPQTPQRHSSSCKVSPS
jgi:hypothetical protein